jgi:hypothetical protein
MVGELTDGHSPSNNKNGRGLEPPRLSSRSPQLMRPGLTPETFLYKNGRGLEPPRLSMRSLQKTWPGLTPETSQRISIAMLSLLQKMVKGSNSKNAPSKSISVNKMAGLKRLHNLWCAHLQESPFTSPPLNGQHQSAEKVQSSCCLPAYEKSIRSSPPNGRSSTAKKVPSGLCVPTFNKIHAK